jgi:hypothetical protein
MPLTVRLVFACYFGVRAIRAAWWSRPSVPWMLVAVVFMWEAYAQAIVEGAR